MIRAGRRLLPRKSSIPSILHRGTIEAGESEIGDGAVNSAFWRNPALRNAKSLARYLSAPLRKNSPK
jgi:hypothetical protein